MNIIRQSKEDASGKNFAELAQSGVYDPRSSSFSRWEWLYAKNPFYSGKDRSAWVYIMNNKPVGHLGIIPVDLQLSSQRKSGGWAVDFITLAEYRKRGIGGALVEEAQKYFDLLLTVGQTDMSFNLFMKMGWLSLGRIPYYIKVWDIKSLVKGKIRNHFLAVIIFILAGFFLKIFNFFKKPRSRKEIKVEVIRNFGREADLLWDGISGFFKMAVPRNFAYLSWKYDSQPGMEYIKMRAARKNAACGYMVTRIVKDGEEDKAGLIVDLVVRPEDEGAISALLFESVKYLRSRGCRVIRCYINQADMEKALRRCGFFSRRPYMRFLINKKIEGIDGIDDLSNWFITAGDCDIDH